jgi:hypothetical protein
LSQRRVSFGAALLGGVVAGVVAALGVIGAVALMGSRAPAPSVAGASSFVAGVAGGILYAIFGGTRRPALWLWVSMLALATLWSALVAEVHAPAGGPNVPYVVGIMVPLRQIGGLLGLLKLGPRGFPAPLVRVFVVTHYVAAALVSLVVPAVAPARARRRGAVGSARA